MKFLKGIMARKREDDIADEQPAISIEALQRDLDNSGLKNNLRDPDNMWGERMAQRPSDEEVTPPDTVRDEHALAAGDAPAGEDRRTVSRDLDWDDELGDASDAELREAFDAPRARRQTRPVSESDGNDEFGPADDGFDEFDEDEFDDEFDELDPEEEQAIRDNALLVDEIRDAIAAVRHIETDEEQAPEATAPAKKEKSDRGWEHDEVFGRKAIARDRLARLAESEDGDRVFDETASKMFGDDDATRRRQAMAHLKAAAAATKADSVLKRVVGRDPAIDPEAQVQYREDLANVVRQRGPRSEPISRPLSRPRTRPRTRTTEPVSIAAADPVAVSMSTDQPFAAFAANAHIPTDVEARAETQARQDAPPEDNQPAEAIMDVEKIDLKTALERQKAILKAEREALEAEIAAEKDNDRAVDADVAPALPDAADDGHPAEARVSGAPVETEQVRDLVETEHAFDDGERDTEEVLEALEEDADEVRPALSSEVAGEEASAFDDWDDGLETDDEEANTPVDVTAVETRPEAEDEAEAVRDLDLETEEAPDTDENTAEEAAPTPEAAAAVPPRRAGRVKTRLLGFQAKSDTRDIFAGKAATGAGPVRFPVGWLVITDGEGFGHSFSLLSGVSKIGRGDDQAVQLDFGDTAISRDNHAAIAFDEELNQFFLGHGGKSNVVRLNGKPVLSTEELYDGDEIRIGETTLRFIALCGEDFTWAENSGDDTDHARSA